MPDFTVHKYSPAVKTQWDSFLASAKNATFLFQRDFMDYHTDRFQDHSLLIYKHNHLFALFPANVSDGHVYSHQGLSYGGLILNEKARLDEVVMAFAKLLEHYHAQGFSTVEIKLLPGFYATRPSGEMEYILFLLNAKTVRTEVASLIVLSYPVKVHGSRKDGIRKAKNHNLVIDKTGDFKPFWDKILTPNLAARHKAKPVHTLQEITLLATRFPENIKQYNVLKEGKIVAGCTIFETMTTAHVQYISADDDRQEHGALDFLFTQLITHDFLHKRYFDFGISNEDGGKKLNVGLHSWKRGFGAQPFAQKTYHVDLTRPIHLKSVLI